MTIRPHRQGSNAYNHRPIGTEKVETGRGVLVRKVTDDPTIPSSYRWRPVHVLMWEAAHGRVPKGYMVVFKAGMKTLESSLITIDRLELVTFAENLRRNSIHTRYPAELVEIIRLNGALKRKVNNRKHAP